MRLAGRGASSAPQDAAAAPARSYSIYLRLLTVILSALALVWVMVIAGTWYITRHEVNELLDTHLEQTALLLAAQPLDEIDEDEFGELEQRPRRGKGGRKYHIHTVYQVWKGDSLLAQSLHAPRQPLGDGSLGFSDARTGQRNWRVFTAAGDDDKVRVMVAEDAEVRHCAFIRGSAIVGKNAVVGNSVELKNVVLFDNVQTPHYNYVGDSILGFKSHMGAGSITSNVKSDRSLVVVKGDAEIPTGRKKFGAVLGDFVEVGCNSVLNPGTVIGRHTNVYPTSSVRGVIPENSIYTGKNDIVLRK